MFYFFIFFSLAIGAIIGSFTNCFIWRLHEDESLLGRSYCPLCRKKIHWYDNIPVISFFLLRGRCRSCGEKISWQYPLVEVAMSLLFATAAFFAISGKIYSGYLFFDATTALRLTRDWFFIFILLVVFVYDLRWYLIPDKVVLPAIVFIFIVNLFLGFSWWLLLLCGLVGAGFFAIQFIVSRGRWMGGGDIRLGLFFGVFFGRFNTLFLAILLAYFIGSVISLLLIAIGRKKWGSQVPLGVFLAPGAILALFFGEKIISWYFGLI
ncbi:MAG: prepilin peptidase [Patescibacteria group bacterium]|jgi:prepilin signal peptidase PulO-like enzyme (type II secretory pathway)